MKKEIKEKIIDILEDYREDIGGISMNYIADQILELLMKPKPKKKCNHRWVRYNDKTAKVAIEKCEKCEGLRNTSTKDSSFSS